MTNPPTEGSGGEKIQPARHDDPEGPVRDWDAGDFGDADYVGDREIAHLPTIADGGPADAAEGAGGVL